MDGRAPRPVQLVPEEDRDAAQGLAERLEAALQPLSGLRDGGEQELADYAVCLTRVLEALAADEEGTPTALYAEEAGAALRDTLRGWVARPRRASPSAPRSCPMWRSR